MAFINYSWCTEVVGEILGSDIRPCGPLVVLQLFYSNYYRGGVEQVLV